MTGERELQIQARGAALIASVIMSHQQRHMTGKKVLEAAPFFFEYIYGPEVDVSAPDQVPGDEVMRLGSWLLENEFIEPRRVGYSTYEIASAVRDLLMIGKASADQANRLDGLLREARIHIDELGELPNEDAPGRYWKARVEPFLARCAEVLGDHIDKGKADG